MAAPFSMPSTDSMGVTCVTVRTTRDMDLIRKGCIDTDDGPTLTTDLIINDKVLDEGKTLMMVEKNLVKSLAELEKELEANHTVTAGGRYEPAVNMAFMLANFMKDTVSNIADQHNAKEKERTEQEKAEEDARLEEEYWADTADIQVPKGSYVMKNRDWNTPTGNKQDCTPQRVNKQVTPAETPAPPSAPGRKITSYATTEANSRGTRKVYIEDPEVVNCEENQIKVVFRIDSYFVQVTLADGEQLTLGPVQSGLIDPKGSSWKFSKGKRLTLTLEKDSKSLQDRDDYCRKKMEMMAKAQQSKSEGGAEDRGALFKYIMFAFVPLVFALVVMFKK